MVNTRKARTGKPLHERLTETSENARRSAARNCHIGATAHAPSRRSGSSAGTLSRGRPRVRIVLIAKNLGYFPTLSIQDVILVVRKHVVQPVECGTRAEPSSLTHTSLA